MEPNPHPAGMSPFWKGRHFDQAMHVTGEVILNGERIPIDCFQVRDRSWSPRPPHVAHEANATLDQERAKTEAAPGSRRTKPKRCKVRDWLHLRHRLAAGRLFDLHQLERGRDPGPGDHRLSDPRWRVGASGQRRAPLRGRSQAQLDRPHRVRGPWTPWAAS